MTKENKDYIDVIDNTLSEIYDYYGRPLIGTVKDLIAESDNINPLLVLRNNIQKNKITNFFKNIQKISNLDIKDFINNLNKKEKVFFVEMINKVIDLDDLLQNYIMSILMKSIKENGNLNYQEKSLYYNLNQLSEDDFRIYYCFYKGYIQNNTRNISISIADTINDKEIVEIVLRRFITFNILQDKSSVVMGNESNIKLKVTATSYSEELYKILDVYFDQNDICTEFSKPLKGQGARI
jgi:hypothetical protein